MLEYTDREGDGRTDVPAAPLLLTPRFWLEPKNLTLPPSAKLGSLMQRPPLTSQAEKEQTWAQPHTPASLGACCVQENAGGRGNRDVCDRAVAPTSLFKISLGLPLIYFFLALNYFPI